MGGFAFVTLLIALLPGYESWGTSQGLPNRQPGGSDVLLMILFSTPKLV